MQNLKIKLPKTLLKEEQLRGARISVYFRWVFVLLLTALLIIQYSLGHQEVSKHAIIFLSIYFLSNVFFSIALHKNYDPRYLRFLGATIDIAVISYHIYGMAQLSDYTAVSAAATIFIIPLFFVIYTFRIDRGLLMYLIFISLLGYNLVYFTNYYQNPLLYNEFLSLSPISQIFKSVYIAVIGLLCIYLQNSVFRFLNKQLLEAEEKSKLDTEVKIAQEKNLYAQKLIEKEKILNKELEDEIRKKDEYSKELKETQELVNNIISNLIGAVSRCLYDKNFTAKFYSDKIYDITGYYATDFIDNKNISFSEIIHPEDAARVKEAVEDSVKNKKPYSLDFRVIHKNGNTVWVHENGQPAYDKKGNIVYLDGITTDITAKKQADIALKKAEEKFKRIVETSPVAISFADIDGKISFVNDMFTNLFGYKIEDIPDFKTYFRKIYPDENYREKISSIWLNATENAKNNKGQIEPYEIVMTCKDGTEKHVIAYTALLEDGYLAIFNDISELKEAEMSLSKAKEELETLNLNLEKQVEERTEQLTKVNTQLLKLQKENLQSQFEVLKQQVNPHFLFNSLNVLTSLIKVDADLAEKFTERLSKVYRHVLENKDKDVIALSTEMEFLKAYIFLLDIRFANKIVVDIRFKEKDFDGYYVVPLALQLLIENAIKHNTFSKKSPLKIEMFIDKNNYLNIINNLQNRESQMNSTGVGVVNISKRYSLLTEKEPVFEMTNKEFIAKIPLISNINDKK